MSINSLEYYEGRGSRCFVLSSSIIFVILAVYGNFPAMSWYIVIPRDQTSNEGSASFSSIYSNDEYNRVLLLATVLILFS